MASETAITCRSGRIDAPMNEIHLELCASPEWATYVETELVPWALTAGDLGDDVLEVGPGPGLTTDALRRHVPRLTAVELDRELADSLARRLSGRNVAVLHGDATDMESTATALVQQRASRCCITSRRRLSKTASSQKSFVFYVQVDCFSVPTLSIPLTSARSMSMTCSSRLTPRLFPLGSLALGSSTRRQKRSRTECGFVRANP